MDAAVILQKLEELKSITVLQFKEALSIEEAAIFTGIAKRTLYDYTSQNRIPYYRNQGGKRIYFKKSELERWMLYSRIRTKESIESEALKKIHLGN